MASVQPSWPAAPASQGHGALTVILPVRLVPPEQLLGPAAGALGLDSASGIFWLCPCSWLSCRPYRSLPSAPGPSLSSGPTRADSCPPGTWSPGPLGGLSGRCPPLPWAALASHSVGAATEVVWPRLFSEWSWWGGVGGRWQCPGPGPSSSQCRLWGCLSLRVEFQS